MSGQYLAAPSSPGPFGLLLTKPWFEITGRTRVKMRLKRGKIEPVTEAQLRSNLGVREFALQTKLEPPFGNQSHLVQVSAIAMAAG